jgi:MFS family permease
MTAGIPGIGLGGLFFVISALLMVVVEFYRTVRGRSSAARWRFVGRQAAMALGMVFATVAALWLLELAIPGNPLEVHVDAGVASTGGSGDHLVATIAAIPLSASPVLGTLYFLVLVLGLTEALRWIVRRPALSNPMEAAGARSLGSRTDRPESASESRGSKGLRS